ncbi:NAD(P)/FAD-dependent oxidoreductase [Patescibacteria group bacterium]
MSTRKILIIGAGPGGLMAAEEAARLGQEVLVLEKNQEYKRKVCAEAVTGKIMNEFPFVYDSVERAFPSAKVVSYQRTCYFRRRAPFLLTINRHKLTDIQISRAEHAGAKIQYGAKVEKIDEHTVKTGNGERFNYDVLIGADGNRSIIRKHLKIPLVFYGLGLQYRIPVETDLPIFHLDPRRWGHTYAWVFPHKGYTSVGTGLSRVQPSRLFVRNLKDLCRELSLPLTDVKLEADIINTDFRGYHFGNIWLVGESSGLISGLAGEGIYNALVMGREVARQIVSGGSTSPAIQERLRKKHLHEMLIRSYYTWPGLVALFYRFAPELKIFKE